MNIYRVRVYGENWETIHEEYISAEDRQAAELEEERIVDYLYDIGHRNTGSSLLRIR